MYTCVDPDLQVQEVDTPCVEVEGLHGHHLKLDGGVASVQVGKEPGQLFQDATGRTNRR